MRSKTQHARPLLVGRACVYLGPKALASGTAGRPAGGRPLRVGLPPSKTTIAACEVKRRTPAPCVTGRGFVESEPTALAVDTVD